MNSFSNVSTGFSGKALPPFTKISKPAESSTTEKLRFKDLGRASKILQPTCVSPDGVQLFRSINVLDIHIGITSRPIPSPGIKPIRNNLQAIRLKNIFQKKFGVTFWRAGVMVISNISLAATLYCTYVLFNLFFYLMRVLQQLP